MKWVRRWPVLVLVVAVCVTFACRRSVPVQPPSETEAVEGVGTSASGAPVVVLSPAFSPSRLVGPTPVASPSPAYSGSYRGTPTPDPTPGGDSSHKSVEAYVVKPGETLSLIAATFGCTVEEIAAANGLAHADRIKAGQKLYIPTEASQTGPAVKLVPDSELVYGPAFIHFDVGAFVTEYRGYLLDYTEDVEGQLLTGTEIVQLVARRFSVGPRVLLTLLELQSGWVTNPRPAGDTLAYPLGHVQAYHEGLFEQLSWAAVQLNEGYYGWKREGRKTVSVSGISRAAIAPGLNAGTAAVQNCLAELAVSWEDWLMLTGSDGFLATYKRLFGNAFAYTVDPVMPPGLTQPDLWLPWESGHTWYFTGGPHGGWGSGSGRAALDFVPSDEHLGCAPSPEWVASAAPGLVLRSENGEVLVDLDGDGFEQSGWVLLYMHVYAEDRVEVGTYLQRGERIGHPSCEGGFADATHLHFARRYNGEWVPAGSGPVPMVLSGWTAHDDLMPYDGTLTSGGDVRVASECWDDEVNGLVSDNSR